MFYEYQKKIAEKLLKNTAVETVFVNARLVQRDKEIFPAYKDNGINYIGVDDTKGFFAYVRQSDNAKFNVNGSEGCNYLYMASIPFRIVFCGVHRSLDSDAVCIGSIMALNGLPVILNQIISDESKLFGLENRTSKQVVFDGSMIYCAVDVLLTIPFSMQECQAEIQCVNEKNVFKLSDFNN